MKNYSTVSKILQVILLLSFVLPFFPPGCDTKKADSDSVNSTTYSGKDSSAVNSKTIQSSDSLSNSYEKSKPKITDKLSKKSKLLKLILRPDDNFSGAGYLIEFTGFFLFECGVVLAFFLWLLSLIIKLKDFNNIFMLTNFLALIAFYFSSPGILNICLGYKLWGYWVCFGIGMITFVFDMVILLKQKKNRRNSDTN
jgi:hypothetical protein